MTIVYQSHSSLMTIIITNILLALCLKAQMNESNQKSSTKDASAACKEDATSACKEDSVMMVKAWCVPTMVVNRIPLDGEGYVLDTGNKHYGEEIVLNKTVYHGPSGLPMAFYTDLDFELLQKQQNLVLRPNVTIGTIYGSEVDKTWFRLTSVQIDDDEKGRQIKVKYILIDKKTMKECSSNVISDVWSEQSLTSRRIMLFCWLL